MMFLATPRASCRFLSISLRTSLEAPLKRMVQALGFLLWVMKVKYSSPICFISNNPQSVPTSDSYSSSGLFTMVAPVTLEILLLSVFLTLLMTVQLPPFIRKCWAASDTPFSVITTSGFTFRISSHILLISSSSISKAFLKSSSLWNSMLVMDSPFLYSRGQSSKTTLGFSMCLLCPGWVTSLLNMTPSKTQQSSRLPPGIFSTLAYLFTSISTMLPSFL
mmetsp:Transcript_24793/g.24305  ORF Transcript_24793/g.24305 Transcript_24793/m.24305 type:complete len:220 (-) Transcript_24793:558-1217(-)